MGKMKFETIENEREKMLAAIKINITIQSQISMQLSSYKDLKPWTVISVIF